MAESVRQLWAKKKNTVAASSVGVVDSLPLSSFKRLEYFVEISVDNTDKSKSFKFSVSNSDSGLRDQVRAKSGDSIDYEIFAKVNATECEIELTNNEAEIIEVTLVRSKL